MRPISSDVRLTDSDWLTASSPRGSAGLVSFVGFADFCSKAERVQLFLNGWDSTRKGYCRALLCLVLGCWLWLWRSGLSVGITRFGCHYFEFVSDFGNALRFFGHTFSLGLGLGAVDIATQGDGPFHHVDIYISLGCLGVTDQFRNDLCMNPGIVKRLTDCFFMGFGFFTFFTGLLFRILSSPVGGRSGFGSWRRHRDGHVRVL